MASRIKGTLDAVVDGRAIGWVWDPDAPDVALEVEVEVDGAPAAAAVAEIERPMLAEAGIGTGHYGFDIALPEKVSGEGERQIEVLAGPDRTPVPPFAQFETVSRIPGSPWAETVFVVAGTRPERTPFVPEVEDPGEDPGAAALAGRDGWLFVKDDHHLDDARLGGAPLITREAAATFAESLALRQRSLRELRMPYFLAVVPLRERFCEVQLPDGPRPPSTGPGRAGQLGAAIDRQRRSRLPAASPERSAAHRRGVLAHRQHLDRSRRLLRVPRTDLGGRQAGDRAGGPAAARRGLVRDPGGSPGRSRRQAEARVPRRRVRPH